MGCGASKGLFETVYQAIGKIDAELGLAASARYRERLVKAAYALMDLELYMRSQLDDYSVKPIIKRQKNTHLAHSGGLIGAQIKIARK